MRRIGLAVVLALSRALPPLDAEAQAARVPRIGYLGNGGPPPVPSELWFNRGLRELGWIEGQTIAIEYRWAEGNIDRLPALAAELVQAKVDVIVAAGRRAVRAARESTATRPVGSGSGAGPGAA